jgi:hypothetical protein
MEKRTFFINKNVDLEPAEWKKMKRKQTMYIQRGSKTKVWHTSRRKVFQFGKQEKRKKHHKHTMQKETRDIVLCFPPSFAETF